MESPKFEKIEYSEEAEELRKRKKPLMYKEGARNKIAFFTKELQERHSIEELHNYEAYCVLAGSTPPEKPEYFDLEDEESIVQFMDALEREFENTDEK